MSDAQARLPSLPCWKGDPSWERLKSGLSNESYLVEDGAGKYVARFGQDFPFHHVDRKREAAASKAAWEEGFAPEPVHFGDGVMVLRYIEGKTYGPEDVRSDIARVAGVTRRFHERMPRRARGPSHLFWPFHVIRDYARTLEEGGSRMAGRLEEFLLLSEALEKVQAPLPIVFGHNDLLPANFIDDGTRLWIIDYEYAAYSTAMFDLAGIASNAELDADQSRALLEAYFGREPEGELVRSHQAMQCASLLREAMWSMVSEIRMTTPGVDYVAYTAENLRKLEAARAAYESAYGKVA